MAMNNRKEIVFVVVGLVLIVLTALEQFVFRYSSLSAVSYAVGFAGVLLISYAARMLASQSSTNSAEVDDLKKPTPRLLRNCFSGPLPYLILGACLAFSIAFLLRSIRAPTLALLADLIGFALLIAVFINLAAGGFMRIFRKHLSH